MWLAIQKLVNIISERFHATNKNLIRVNESSNGSGNVTDHVSVTADNFSSHHNQHSATITSSLLQLSFFPIFHFNRLITLTTELSWSTMGPNRITTAWLKNLKCLLWKQKHTIRLFFFVFSLSLYSFTSHAHLLPFSYTRSPILREWNSMASQLVAS